MDFKSFRQEILSSVFLRKRHLLVVGAFEVSEVGFWEPPRLQLHSTGSERIRLGRKFFSFGEKNLVLKVAVSDGRGTEGTDLSPQKLNWQAVLCFCFKKAK